MRDSPGKAKESPDLDLVDRVRRGNLKDFSVLVDRYKDRAFTLAVRILGDHEVAEEAVQDAFLKAYRGIPSFRGDSAFGTWFYRIVYNCCITRTRKTAVTRISLDDPEGPELVSEEPLADELLEGMELATLVERTLEALPGHWRSVVTLYYMDEMSYEQIAGIMGIPMGTVKTYLFRARQRLKVMASLRVEEGR